MYSVPAAGFFKSLAYLTWRESSSGENKWLTTVSRRIRFESPTNPLECEAYDALACWLLTLRDTIAYVGDLCSIRMLYARHAGHAAGAYAGDPNV